MVRLITGLSATCLLWLALTLTPAAASNPEEINVLLARGDYEAALELAESAIAESPENRQLKMQKGFALIRLRRLEQAEDYYRQLIKEMPDDPEPMNNLGVIFQLQRRYPETIRQLEETIQRFPDFHRAYENLGDTYVQIATTRYRAGLEQDPEDPALIAKADVADRFYLLARQEQTRNSLAALVVPDPVQDASLTEEGELQPAEDQVTPSESAVLEFLHSWQGAWSSRDLPPYFGHYSDQFEPRGGIPRWEWEQRKERIIGSAEYIQLSISDLKIESQEDGRVSVDFLQGYESDTFRSEDRKVLELANENGSWKIVSER